MKRNRKREPLQVGTVGKSFLACVCVAVLGIGYVWQKNQIYRLGDEVKNRETVLQAGQKRNTMLAAQLAHLKSPAELEARCQQYSLGLVAPRESQVVRVYEPGVEWDEQFASALQRRPQRFGSQPKVVAQR
jgi:cell division protein FtsL